MDKVEQCLPSGYVLAGKEHDYIIESCLGQGSFGITYLAKTRIVLVGNMGRGRGWMQVAVKEFFMRDLNSRDESTLSLQNTADDGLIAKYRRAFLREANNLSQMQHPNIVNVIEVVEANNTAYIVMEYVEGCNLDDYIKSKGAIPEGEALVYFRQLCEAMCYMHEHRMLHLDIKPKNIMHEDDGHVCLIDFGLSKQYTESGEPESSTTIGLGTPGYAPLEQVQQRDDRTDFRMTLDVYALGATLYKMLTGKTPPMANEVNDAILDGDDLVRNELRRAGVSETVAKTISTAMWPGSKKRYQTVAELMNVLNWQEKTCQVEAMEHFSSSNRKMLENEDTVIEEVSPIIHPLNVQPLINPNAGTHNSHEWVDLGLSVKWATMNVGATSPEGYGDYFAWGETTPKSMYDWNAYKWCNGCHMRFSGPKISLTKYSTREKYGLVDNKTRLDLCDDAAQVNWGDNWRMPTSNEIKELKDKCTWTWTALNGVMGYNVTGKNGNHIFFPAAGYRFGGELDYAGFYGNYWSSSLLSSDDSYAYDLFFNSDNWGWSHLYGRCGGRTVRAVCS